MIVIRLASSHQISTSKSPRVPAHEVTKATMIANESRVIIPGLRSASSPRAPRRKGRPPYRKTIVPRMAAAYRSPGKVGTE
jgi:hypothetical protein